MRRGFKTGANAIAREVRKELGLARTSPIDVWRLAEHLGIPVMPLSDLREEAPLAAELFLNGGRGMFSGATVFRGHERMIVFNDAHALGRQVSDIGHELAHGLLLHPPSPAMDGRGSRFWDREVEEEADWLSGALLVPEEGALMVVRRGWTLAEGAEHYGVTEQMVRFRVNVTGAKKRVKRVEGREH